MMPNAAEITGHLRDFIQENFFIEPAVMAKIKDDDILPEQGVIDSFGILELIRHVEAHYGIQFAEDDIRFDNVASIQALAKFILTKVKP